MRHTIRNGKYTCNVQLQLLYFVTIFEVRAIALTLKVTIEFLRVFQDFLHTLCTVLAYTYVYKHTAVNIDTERCLPEEVLTTRDVRAECSLSSTMYILTTH